MKLDIENILLRKFNRFDRDLMIIIDSQVIDRRTLNELYSELYNELDRELGRGLYVEFNLILESR